LICWRSPEEEAAYSWEASDNFSFADGTGGGWNSKSTRGDMGGDSD